MFHAIFLPYKPSRNAESLKKLYRVHNPVPIITLLHFFALATALNIPCVRIFYSRMELFLLEIIPFMMPKKLRFLQEGRITYEEKAAAPPAGNSKIKFHCTGIKLFVIKLRYVNVIVNSWYMTINTNILLFQKWKFLKW